MGNGVARATARKSPSRVTVFGYEVLDVIGRGAGSTLFVASDPASGQVYALKHVRVESDRDVRFVDQLRNEFEVSRAVAAHPALRRAVEYKERRGSLLQSRRVAEAVLLLEMFDGASLEQSPPEGLGAVIACFVRVAEGLGAMHRVGFVHCDVKPSNVLTGADGDVRVIDLGQACRAGTVKPRIQGTPDYIAPEQVRCKPVTARTDVFNLGATLYAVLAGRKLPTLYTAGQGGNHFVVDGCIPSPAELDARVPTGLSNLVMECVRTNPAKRPADMRDVALRLQIAEHALRRRAAV
jgi:serine/threonine-protein kinase